MGALTEHFDAIAQRVEGRVPAQAAADAMADSMRSAIADVIGSDLRMSRFHAGPVRITATVENGRATVTMSGATYTLADKGRRHMPRDRIRARHRSALATPFGPKASVRGSLSDGFSITEEAGPKALQAATEAARRAIEKGS